MKKSMRHPNLTLCALAWVLQSTLVAIATITCLLYSTASTNAQTNRCPTDGVEVKTTDGRFEDGIECNTSSSEPNREIRILLEDGYKITGDGRRGIEIHVRHPIKSIEINTGGSNSFIKGGQGKAGIYIRNHIQTNHKFDTTIFANNAEAANNNVIRVYDATGDVKILSLGTITMRGAAGPGNEYGAIHVGRVTTPVSFSPTTDISVHNINNFASRTGNAELVAGIAVTGPGKISVTSSGTILTTKNEAYGISVLLDTFRSTALVKPGVPGSVDVSVNNIMTIGNDAHAIEIERLGDTRPTTGIAAPLKLTISGKVATTGNGSHAIAISGQKAKVEVTIKSGGSVAAKGQNSHAIYVFDKDNFAIASTDIKNYGTVTGDVYVEGCADPEFVNFGIFNIGSNVKLIRRNVQPGCGDEGASSALQRGQLKNHGTLSPGGRETIANTNLTGDLVQFKSGFLEFDIDWSKKTSDQIRLTGLATLEGKIRLNHLVFLSQNEVAKLDTGERVEVTVMTTTSGITGLPKVEFGDSLLLPLGVRKDAGNLIVWARPVNDLPGLNQNQRNILTGILAARESNDEILKVYRNLVPITLLSYLQLSLDGMGNEIAGASIQAAIRVTNKFAQMAPSCFENLDLWPSIVNNTCVKFSAAVAQNSRKQSFEERDHRTDLSKFTASFGWRIDNPNLDFELLLGMHQSSTTIRRLANSRARGLLAGIRMTGNTGPLRYQMVIVNNTTDHNIARTLPFGHGVSTATMRSTNQLLDVETGYQFKTGSLVMSPFVGFGVSKYKSNSYTETGGGDLSYKVNPVNGNSSHPRAGISVAIPKFTGVRDILFAPHFNFQWTGSASRRIEVDSQFTGGQDLVRSTTTLPLSSIAAGIGVQFRSLTHSLTGHAALAAAMGANNQSTKISFDAGLSFNF